MIELKHKEKTKDAVLLLHGMTGAPGELYHLGKSCHDKGFDVFIPVLPGHCQGTEAIKRTVWQDWYNFSIAEFDRLKAEYEDVYVSGICLGAVLALDIAIERKSVKGIVCLSTTLYLNGWSIPKLIALLPVVMYTVLKFFYAWPEGGALGVKSDKARSKVKQALEKDDSDFLDCFPTLCILQILRLSRYTRKNLHRVRVPVLIMHSEKDDITSKESADEVYKKISSAKKEYILLKNSYHLITLDNEKEFVFQKTTDFFMELKNASTSA
jgi:carboxylesterase